MEGKQSYAMDIATTYRGIIGGIGVAISSTVAENYQKSAPRLLSRGVFLSHSPVIIFCK